MGLAKTMASERLVPLLGRWTAGEGPLFRRLADALSGSIERGELPPLTRLPPERALAQALAVSRTTVIGAYRQLKEGGWLSSRRGSGTWVSRLPNSPGQRADGSPTPAGRGASELLSRMPGAPAPAVDLSVTSLSALPLVWDAYESIGAKELRELGYGRGYEPAGLPTLRLAIADAFADAGVPTRPEEVLVTSGTAQAISLLAAHYLRPGDAVVVEDPTWPLALAVLRSSGVRLLPAPVGPRGADAGAVEGAFRRASPRLAYVTPDFNNPTGASMGTLGRRGMAELAERFQIPIVEDTTNSGVALGAGLPPPPIAAFGSGDAPVLTVGSLSKLFWAGLRVGWVRGPAPTIARLARLKTVADLGTPLPAQLHASRLLPLIEEARAQRREQLLPRLDLLTGLLSERLPSWTWDRPVGGLSLWVRMPSGGAAALAQAAQRQGITVLPGPACSVCERHEDRLRLSFAEEPSVIAVGAERLARAWAAFEPTRPGDARPAADAWGRLGTPNPPMPTATGQARAPDPSRPSR
jgi:DNA-binding transcriptional MocR family regulator